MGNSESRPSPGEDPQQGSHGGDGGRAQTDAATSGRSSQAAGKDPHRDSAPDRRRPEEPRAVETARDHPPLYDTDPGAGPPGSEAHARGWREGDPEADSAVPAREAGAGGGKVDGPAGAGGQMTGARRDS